tara:strand:- start:395 stop:688 length:294 start_codon:yes stop_codon:yes gene_type:complete
MESTGADLTSVENEVPEKVSEKPADFEVQVSTAQLKNEASPYTALTDSLKGGVGNGQKQIRFFGPRFLAIWVMPIAITGILMEFLFISPLRNLNPFN